MKDATVVVVALRLDPPRLERCAALLDAGEAARADRFLRGEDRARFIASHAALRVVLGRALSTDPAGVAFRAETTGRPALALPSGGLDFNLSHSGDRALIGLARDARIGVDVEVRRPLPDALRIARAHFAPGETRALAALPPETREAAFFDLWTRKEAVVKALGAGLSLPLAAFQVTVPPDPPRLLAGASGPDGWTLAGIEAGHGTAATVAVTAPNAAILVKHLPTGWPDHFPAK